MNIYLIGMMGSGKSTIGKMVAQKMRLPFIDLDLEIENFAGKPINEIFKKYSEEFFRKIESECLKIRSNSILACGGGIVSKNENISYINKHGKTILLTAPLSELYQRLSGTNNRPLLKNGNIKQTLERLWLERKSKYIDMADLTINTSNRSPKDISIEIVESI
mgnify:CR=1 FL=1